MNRPLYSIPLADQELSDEDIRQLAQSIPVPSVVLLDDLDRAMSRCTFSVPEGRISNGATQNASIDLLDGVDCRAGHIFVVVTNDTGKLDKAIVRPGRIDVEAVFPLLCPKLAKDMFLRWYKMSEKELRDNPGERNMRQLELHADTFERVFPKNGFSPAFLQAYLQTRESAKEAVAEIQDLSTSSERCEINGTDLAVSTD